MKREWLVILTGLSVACDFNGDLEKYCEETGRCTDGGSSSGGAAGGASGGVAGGASGGTSGGSSGGTSGGLAGGSSGGTSGGVAAGSSGGTAGGISGGLAGGSSGGTSGGFAGGSSGGAAGGSSGGTSGGVAGGAPSFVLPQDVVLTWRADGGARPWTLNLDGTPKCLGLRLEATWRDGGAYQFPTQVPFNAVLRLSSTNAPPLPNSASVLPGCMTGSAFSFEPDASVAELVVNTARFGLLSVVADVGGRMTSSPQVTAMPSTYLVLPRDGGQVTESDAGLCVEYELVTQAVQTFTITSSRKTVDALEPTAFQFDFPGFATMPKLVSNCATQARIPYVSIDAGTARENFGFVFDPSVLGMGAFGFVVRAPAGLGTGGATVDPSPTRFCTPVNMGPGSACGSMLECCTSSALCSVAGPTMEPVCN